MTKTKGAAHKAWLDELRKLPREEAAKVIAERYPHLSGQEVQRRLASLDALLPTPLLRDTPPPTNRIIKARAALRRAMLRARGSPRWEDDLSTKLLARAEKGDLNDL